MSLDTKTAKDLVVGDTVFTMNGPITIDYRTTSNAHVGGTRIIVSNERGDSWTYLWDEVVTYRPASREVKDSQVSKDTLVKEIYLAKKAEAHAVKELAKATAYRVRMEISLELLERDA